MSAAAMCQRANSKTSEFTSFLPQTFAPNLVHFSYANVPECRPAAGMAEAGARGGDTDLEESAIFETDNGC
jgi:hypothetical protein